MRFYCKCFCILYLFSFSLFAEENSHAYTLEEAKAHYTFETFKHITWPNEANIEHFVLGVITKNIKLVDALNQLENRKIRDKKVIFKRIFLENLQSQYYSAILLDEPKTSSILQISTQYPQALIITNGQVNKENLMVALVTHNNDMKIELNRENLRKHGFSVSNSLLNFGGTKQDLNQQLKEKEIYLQQLKLNSKTIETELIELNQSLQLTNSELAANQEILLQSQKKLTEKNEELNVSQNNLNTLQQERDLAIIEKINNQKSIEQQKKLITVKQIELELHQQNLQLLNKEIKKNELRQKQQLLKLHQQNAIIMQKEKTITNQRLLLYIATGITCLVLLLIYFIMRLNRTRNKDNKELVVLNEQLYELATTDSMTKLFNRLHFLESAQIQMTQLQRNKSEGAILMMDIDHFKNVNDNYGHATGDEAIISVANVFKENLREYDIVGRLGGEEYGMLLANCPIEKATEIAERLREKIEILPLVFNDKIVNLTISIGLTPIHNVDDIDQALQRADKALYQAKNAGRNKVICTSIPIE